MEKAAFTSEKLFDYFNDLGWSELEIARVDLSTRWYHDLRNSGDTAEEDIMILQKKGVDLSSFIFNDYFPTEAEELSLFLWLRSFALRFFMKQESQYKPLTIAMLRDALEAGTWDVNL